jgi:formylglycine-generating enzyme required for sulfatase activity
MIDPGRLAVSRAFTMLSALSVARCRSGAPEAVPPCVCFCSFLLLAPVLLTFTLGWRRCDAAPAPMRPAAKSLTNSIGMKLMLIPAGTYQMGSPDTEPDRDDCEGPRHQVTITASFYLGVYEVTQEEYRQVMGMNPSHFRAGGERAARVRGMDTRRFPVENVSWEEAVKFCKKLSASPREKRAGLAYRLPTEAEWEYACRAGTSTAFHTGPSLALWQANFNGNDPPKAAHVPYRNRTMPVGSYKPNTFGLYDMHGNVCEWCADWFDEANYTREPRRNPRGPAGGSLRVLRGGCWWRGEWSCRSAYRTRSAPEARWNFVGFRVACVALRVR